MLSKIGTIYMLYYCRQEPHSIHIAISIQMPATIIQLFGNNYQDTTRIGYQPYE